MNSEDLYSFFELPDDSFYTGKTILVTGGGGSIGSELCRRLAAAHPKKLIILDINENGAYDVVCDTRETGTDISVEIASICNVPALERIFDKYRPEIVFHAAAHKHVPLMENCILEAVKNNVCGTFYCMDAAMRCGTERFLLISTDKAVDPINVMGATKRACEVMAMLFAKKEKTVFTTVRFGNVVGSAGSVVPLFCRQIEKGGPVTITDSRATRFFMDVSEAVALVMQACAFSDRGGTYVLNMGRQMSILGIAEHLIRDAGFEPYRDIKIVETGLRPGEKLHEVIVSDTRDLSPMYDGKIFSIEDYPVKMSERALRTNISLISIAESYGKEDIVLAVLKRFVPEFKASEYGTEEDI